MIHIFVGTKAQLIKMMPIMQVLARQKIPFNFIDAGQHGGITADLIAQFALPQPDVHLRQKAAGIQTVAEALRWSLSSLGHLTISKTKVFEEVFKSQRGICLIHGDTLTTFISLLYAKRCQIEVAHVEAGLRSINYVDRFPEEMIRLMAMRYSDLLFVPSAQAWQNISRLGYIHKSVHIHANTGQDAVRCALQQDVSEQLPSNYVVITIHRLETLFSKQRMVFVTDQIHRLARSFKVIFVLHPPTRRQLKRYGLLKNLSDAAIELRDLQPYTPFIHLLAQAEFVLTDGGSIQEECFYLDKPCLIMRTKTERQEGIGENARLSMLNRGYINEFVENYQKYRRRSFSFHMTPSETIVRHLRAYI